MLKHIIKEPLFAFLLLGTALFALYLATDTGTELSGKNAIVVTQPQVNALVQRFEKMRQRSPSTQERESMIQSFIREEILYREALAMGLDQEDAIVRRRLTQKLAYLSEDLAESVVPEEQQLQAYLEANAETYRTASSYSFQHVLLSAEHREAPEKLLALLQEKKIDPSEAGEISLLPKRFNEANDYTIERTFGSEFLNALAQLSPGKWHGPLVSGYGLHLVYLSESKHGTIPPLSSVRQEVLRDWSAQHKKEASEAFYQILRQRYKVSVEEDTLLNNNVQAPTRNNPAVALDVKGNTP